MCGIVGFTGKPDSSRLEEMTNKIIHRGPDDSAYIVNKNFSVGFRRLAIIDLSTNIYPIENEEETLELVLNGEIYNYKELRIELEKLGHIFKTNSDSETIVHGYEQWGKGVLEKLRGMFVFVILDKNKNTLFIARDRLGIKPWYYALHEGRMFFGSEIKAVLETSNMPRKANDVAVYRFLTQRVHDIDENTFFAGVQRLLPGHYMEIEIREDKLEYNIEKYWHPTFNENFGSAQSDADYAKEFGEIFKEAVDLHIIADVPVGLTLSGGLDSSGITMLASNHFKERDLPNPLVAFSAIHPGEKIDEQEYIDTVVADSGIESIKIQPNVDNFWEELDDWIYFQEEPVISGAPYAYFTVMREARKRVTVLLSGQGGDELLAGYLPYFYTYLQSALDQRQFGAILRESWKAKDLYGKFAINAIKNKLSKKNVLSATKLLRKNFSNAMQEFALDAKYSRNLNERLFTDVTKLTTPSLLRYEDKNSMANSLESRVPFFDHKVVEYIFNLPIDQKIKFGWTRFVYRESMKGILPEKIRKRRSKVGFTNPEWEWIERKKDKFVEIFESNSFIGRPYWEAKSVKQDFLDALNGKLRGDVLIFWRFFIVEMWLRRYVD